MPFLTRERLTIYPRIIVAMYVVLGGTLVFGPALLGRGMLDQAGHPAGTDFICFWTVSKLARAGTAPAAYDLSFLQGAERAVLGVEFPLPWYYPPTALLIVLPLSLLPYLPSFLLWASATLAGYLLILRRIAPHPATLWLALAFPGTFQNFFHGQNGFLSAFLVGTGLLLLDRAPLRAGLLLGLMSYKPQLAVLIPVALIAGRCWRALAGAAASAAAVALTSALAFGSAPWRAFLDHAGIPLKMLEVQASFWPKTSTMTAAVRSLGGSMRLALILQAISATAAAVAVIWVWTRPRPPIALRASALVLGSLMVTPHLFEYDLALLALPIAWLAWQAHQEGWRPHEPALLLCAWAMPLLTPAIARLTHLQLGPFVVAALMLLVLRRSAGLKRAANPRTDKAGEWGESHPPSPAA